MIETEHLADYIGKDLAGYYYNKKYPPQNEFRYSGYKTPNQEVFFYDYVVQGYGVTFKFHGVNYLIPEDNPRTLIDTTHDITVGEYEDPIQLLEKAEVDGKTLISIIDMLENVDLQ